MNLPIRDLEPIERDELVSLLADHEMLLAYNQLLPIKFKGNLYLINIKGEVADASVMQAVLNGYEIDTSASIDPETQQLRILDVEVG